MCKINGTKRALKKKPNMQPPAPHKKCWRQLFSNEASKSDIWKKSQLSIKITKYIKAPPLPPANVEQYIAFHHGINCKRHHTLFYNIGWGEGVSHLFPLVVENWAVICIVPLYFVHDCLKKKIGQGFCSCVKKSPPGCNVFLLPSSLIILLIYLFTGAGYWGGESNNIWFVVIQCMTL